MDRGVSSKTKFWLFLMLGVVFSAVTILDFAVSEKSRSSVPDLVGQLSLAAFLFYLASRARAAGKSPSVPPARPLAPRFAFPTWRSGSVWPW
jgi:hypothetical protein